jgi:superfamily II DNA or RNA helicase
MNRYDGILEFQGEWRTYQKRILDSSDKYFCDHKIHIVAPPGSGKTTLGIELIRRLGEPCLILSPSLVIRQQWLDRIREAFLSGDAVREKVLSSRIQSPALITSITYQSLYSAMSQTQEEEEEQTLDYTGFNLLETVRTGKIKTICLDECHHLRSEWWKALEEFIRELEDVSIVALTATPPYDAPPLEWERYNSLCGPIDEEILVPELVKEGSLCPHQDYVYFNFPTREEQRAVTGFRKEVKNIFGKLMEEEAFARSISTHMGIGDYVSCSDSLLENPPYLSSLLIFYEEKGLPYPNQWIRLLGVKRLPRMDLKWMEILLQGFLYDDTESYLCEETYREELIKELKQAKLIEKKRVGLVINDSIEKMLINSKGKLNSIEEIVCSEYVGMQGELRMLILTDYIRKEYKPALGNPDRDVDSIGVLPIFEMLRRRVPSEVRLGILCGGIVILPSEAVSRFCQLAKEETGTDSPVSCRELTDVSGVSLGYAEVFLTTKQHNITRLVTRILEEGYLQVLIGTKALLGEGWDSPCINSLILASFVGSYVLSNQMRGRAIRVMPHNPGKTSNIWHLVCLEEQMPDMGESQDFLTLKRRLEGFLGVSYTGTTIENGVERLTAIKQPFTKKSIPAINENMKELAKDRERLKMQWRNALVINDKMEAADECRVPRESLKKGLLLFNVIGAQMLYVLMELCNTVFYRNARRRGDNFVLSVIFLLISAVCVIAVTRYGGRLARRLTPFRRLQSIGNGIHAALRQRGYILSEAKVVVEETDGLFFYAWLKGGTTREKDLFASCLSEFLGVIDNQRYLLYAKGRRRSREHFFCVPSLFAKTKEDAVLFQSALKPCLGIYQLIYTRNPEGRRLLQKARCQSFANRSDRLIHRDKKIKNALE